jgi:glutamate-1-semialdehyde aminotransferase
LGGSVDWGTVVSTVVGVLAGGGISAYFSWRGSQELRHEAERLRRQTELLMRGLEEAAKAGNFEWNRNEQGEIIGIAFKR